LFSPELRRRTIFVCVFWSCNVAPYFTIFTFAPQVFTALGLADERASTIAANKLGRGRRDRGMLTIERVGRRRQLIPAYWIMAVALLVVGLWSGAPAGVVMSGRLRLLRAGTVARAAVPAPAGAVVVRRRGRGRRRGRTHRTQRHTGSDTKPAQPDDRGDQERDRASLPAGPRWPLLLLRRHAHGSPSAFSR
jgi:hypothetical protein